MAVAVAVVAVSVVDGGCSCVVLPSRINVWVVVLLEWKEPRKRCSSLILCFILAAAAAAATS